MADGPGGRFQKGHKYAKGGKRPGAGGLTKEKRAEKLSFLQALEREREKRATALAKRYFLMAEYDPATMRHAVDGVQARAKQEIGVSGSIDHGLNHESIIALMATKEGREAALAVTRVLTGQSKP